MNLNYKEFGSGFPVIILHGLLGSLDNWQTIARRMADITSGSGRPLKFYIVDQRNHGKSPHTDDFNYKLLSNDLLEFFNQRHITRASIIGHSMGGKAAMQFALEHAEMVEKLIAVDITPSQADDHHSYIFEALDAADVAHATSRGQVQDVLYHRLGDDKTTIQFLMKGLQRDLSEKHFEWKFNLKALWNHYGDIMDSISGPAPYTGPALFIKGENSNYINAASYPAMIELFPNHELVEISHAGHWVQAENPDGFIEAAGSFLLK